MVLEKTLKSPLDNKEIKPVNPKEISPEYSLEGLMLKLKLQYFGHLMQRASSLEKTLMLGKTEGKRTDAEAPIPWPPDAKHQLIGKDPVAGKDWRQKEKGATENKMVRYHHQLNGHEFEQTLEDSGTEESGILQSMGSQRAGPAEQQQIKKLF